MFLEIEKNGQVFNTFVARSLKSALLVWDQFCTDISGTKSNTDCITVGDDDYIIKGLEYGEITHQDTDDNKKLNIIGL